jgi:glycosyltransferase involved in cell wall biosynthesis
MKMITKNHIAIVCPTKDRPDRVLQLIKSIADQTEIPAQVIVTDSGKGNEQINEIYGDKINILHLQSPTNGQVLQRNYAYAYIEEYIKIVINLDDHIILRPETIEQFIKFWNKENSKLQRPLAGISFNFVDRPRLKNSWMRRLFFLSTQPPGSVSKGGYAAPFVPADTDIASSWLFGGATAWSKEVLLKHRHPISFPTRWAVCEDLIYSYPLHFKFRLLVAKDVVCTSSQNYASMSFRQGIFYGVSSAIMRYHFIRQHAEMKTWAWLWMTIGVVLGNLAKGMLGSPRHLGLFAGGVEGIARACLCSLRGGDSEDLARQLAMRRS